jgi:protoporphyrinogen oxidase
MRACVIGAGFAGLAAAHDLVRDGHDVVLLERLDRPGGLAAGFADQSWSWQLECFYHHLFATDDAILDLARETGFGPRILSRRPVTALFYHGRPYALDGPLPVLRFPGVPFLDRVRMGLAVAYLKAARDWRRLEHVTAADWARRWMGDAAYRVIWQPLLEGKFGADGETVPMSWLWARLHKRSMRLLYFEGGFHAFAEHLAQLIRQGGATVRYGARVARVERRGDGLTVTTDAGDLDCDAVIATVGPHLFSRLVAGLPDDYLAGLARMRHLGAVVGVLALRQRLMDEVYWLSMDKRDFPFLAVVEHTNFMDREPYGGDHLVYVGDYLPPEHRYFHLADEDVLGEWYAALPRINAAFDPSWVRRTWLFRSTYAQPVVPLGFSRHIPPLASPVPGVYLASMSQVYPWDRGTNYAVEIGRRAAALAAGRPL